MRGYVSEYRACGDCSVAHKSELIEILEFTHFFEHFTFDKTDYSERGKHMKKYIRVVVAVELVTVAQTPYQFQPTVYNLIRNLSENVILPIAGIILTFIACYECSCTVEKHKTWIASPATIPKSGERNRKIHSCMLYLISI